VLSGTDAQEAGAPHYGLGFLVEGLLAVEMDSVTHEEARGTWGAKRDAILARLGCSVLRLRNEEVTEKDVAARCIGFIGGLFVI
jgi:very-short-patch-repair endonuclease